MISNLEKAIKSNRINEEILEDYFDLIDEYLDNYDYDSDIVVDYYPILDNYNYIKYFDRDI